jgi:hypothetical protein
MTTKPASLGIIHKILIVFVIINIVGEIGNVVFWWANSASRSSLNQGYVGVTAGNFNALIAGTIVLLSRFSSIHHRVIRLDETNEVGTTTNHRNLRSKPRPSPSLISHKPSIRVLGSLVHNTHSLILF